MAWQPQGWDDYIGSFAPTFPPIDPNGSNGFAPTVPPGGEGGSNIVQLAQPHAPTVEEVPQAAIAQPLSPEEEAQIQIEQPRLSPEEEAQIQLLPEQPAPLTPPLLGNELEPLPGPALVPQSAPIGPAGMVGQTLDATKQPQIDPEYMTADELAAYESNRPIEEQVAFNRDIDRKREEFALEQRKKADDAQAAALEENARQRQQRIEAANQRAVELDAEAKQLADMTPWEKLSDGQKLGGVIASIVGGFASMHGGRNIGIDAVKSIADSAAQRHAEQLQLNARQRVGVGDMREQANEDFRQAQLVKLATYDSAIKKMETDVQQFNPRGSNAQRILGDINKVRALRADELMKSHEADLKAMHQRAEDDYKLAQTEKERAATEKLRAETAGIKAKAAGGGAGGAGVAESADYWEVYGGLRPPMAKATKKEYDAWLATQGKVKSLIKGPGGDKTEAQTRKEEADAKIAEQNAAKDVRERSILDPSTGKAIVGADGQPLLATTADEGKAMRDQVRETKVVLDNADRLAEKARQLGPSILKGKAAAEFESESGAFQLFVNKMLGMGALDEGGQRALDRQTGGSPTDLSARGIASWAGIGTASGEVVAAKLTALANVFEDRQLTRLGNPPGFSFHRSSSLPKAQKTEVDEIGGRLISSLLKLPANVNPNDPLAVSSSKISQAIVAPQNKNTDDDFDSLAVYAKETRGKNGPVARAHLREIAEKAVYPDARAKAKAILESLPAAEVSEEDLRPRPRTSEAR